ncbi:MAG: RDD family protein [Gammaproteobacteria bacterium]|nr:RDD family protein [Gammaproteobacteria bacterium]
MWLDWQQLGIEPTLDQRAIKRAYAVRLKQCRPDEQPEAFQRLHAAYKQVLEWAAWQARQQAEEEEEAAAEEVTDSPEPQQPPAQPEAVAETLAANEQAQDPAPSAEIIPFAFTPSLPEAEAETTTPPLLSASTATAEPEPEPEPTTNIGQPPGCEPAEPAAPLAATSSIADETNTPEERSQRDPYAEEGNRLLTLVDDLLINPRRVVQPASWQFLAESPLILDLHFNWHLGVRVFERVARYNSQRSNASAWQQSEQPLPQTVLQTLDGLFNWEHNRNHLQRIFDDELAEAMLNQLDQPQPTTADLHSGLRGGKVILASPVLDVDKVVTAPGARRIGATLIDTLLVVLPINVIDDYLQLPWPDLASNISSKGAVMLVVLVLLLWLGEGSRRGATPGKLILGLKVVKADLGPLGFGRSLIRTLTFLASGLGSYLTLLINAILLHKGGRLIHDQISRTMVIDVRNSR